MRLQESGEHIRTVLTRRTCMQVPVPQHRMTPLKDVWLKLYQPITEVFTSRHAHESESQEGAARHARAECSLAACQVAICYGIRLCFPQSNVWHCTVCLS